MGCYMIISKYYNGNMCDPSKSYVEADDYDNVLYEYKKFADSVKECKTVVPVLDEVYMIGGKRHLCTEKTEKIDRRSGRITITATYERLYTGELPEDWDEIGTNNGR